MIRYICYIGAILLASNSQAQNSNTDPIIRVIELVTSSNADKPVDIEELTHKLQDLMSMPISINDTTKQNLENLFMLSDFQLESLQDYIKNMGEIKSLNELQFVPGFDMELANAINPFITLSKPAASQLRFKDIRFIKSELMLRSATILENSYGFRDTSYKKFQGNKFYYAGAYDIILDKFIHVNFHAEKDIGEPAPLNKGFRDSFSGSIVINTPAKYISKIILGDYRLNLGQGLLAWSSFSFGKDGDPASIRKRASVAPFKSFGEAYFYRGAAIEVPFKAFKLMVAASHRLLDGHLSTHDSTGIIFLTSGLHRTQPEIESRNNIKQNMVALTISHRIKNQTVALNYFYKSNAIENLNDTENGVSIDFNGRIRKTYYFGEFASDNKANIAAYFGANLKLSPKAMITTSLRKYPHHFNSRSNNSFGENSNAANEEGIYVGLKITPRYQFAIIAYIDMFRFKYPTYRISKPSDGTEVGLSCFGSFSDQHELKFRIRQKSKEQDIKQQLGSYSLTERIAITKADATWKYSPLKATELTINGSISRYVTESFHPELGYLMYVNFRYAFEKIRLQLHARFAVFNADSWDVAQYCYENDLPGMYTSSSFFQKRSRAYVFLSAKMTRHLRLWLKVGQTYYSPPTQSIGSGIDEISGNKKTEIRVQTTISW